MGYISHHIMPLVINSLRRGNTHKHTLILMFEDKVFLRNQACTSLQPVHACHKTIDESICLLTYAVYKDINKTILSAIVKRYRKIYTNVYTIVTTHTFCDSKATTLLCLAAIA